MKKRILILFIDLDELDNLLNKVKEIGIMPANGINSLPHLTAHHHLFETPVIMAHHLPEKLKIALENGLEAHYPILHYRPLEPSFSLAHRLPLELELDQKRMIEELLALTESRRSNIENKIKQESAPFFYNEQNINKWKQKFAPSFSASRQINCRVKKMSWRNRQY